MDNYTKLKKIKIRCFCYWINYIPKDIRKKWNAKLRNTAAKVIERIESLIDNYLPYFVYTINY